VALGIILLVIGVGMIKWRNALGVFYCRVGLESIKDHPFVADVMDVEQAYDKKSAPTIFNGGGCILSKRGFIIMATKPGLTKQELEQENEK
jgi:hypothetical protein